MDTETEKLCLEEIDHVVLDGNKKVTLAYIANTWNVPFKDGEVVLEKWLNKYSGDKKIAKEFLIRGNDLNGNSVITIVKEKRLPKVEKICPNHSRTLYSIEIASENGKSLNLTEPSTNKFITLKLDSTKRDVKVNPIVIPPSEKVVKKEADPPKKPSLFGAVEAKPDSTKETKTESKDVKIKEEKKSPKAQSPKKDTSAKPSKAPPGIASFFSKPSASSAAKPSAAKPSTAKAIADTASKIEKVKIEDSSDSSKSVPKSTQKRPHANTSDSNEEAKSSVKKEATQTKKKIKLEPKASRSRLMQICDSSSDEEGASTSMETEDVKEPVVVKKEKENKTPSPEKPHARTNGNSSSGKRRVKVKKMVTKTYEDEDGFINTVREMEEVSCSDEEPEVIEVPKKIAPNTSHTTATKKKVSPPAGKKQGSILSFFGKK